MESEARLVMLDHGLPRPELQYLIRGRADGGEMTVARRPGGGQYDSVEWHAGRMEMLRDKARSPVCRMPAGSSSHRRRRCATHSGTAL